VAIVTGAAGGIGAATARRLAAEGAGVAIADIQDGPGEASAGEIRAAGGKASYP
jgi:NAD(P)-dependent dehydrogenase (short-subunit alcohol dehydrogenase family)